MVSRAKDYAYGSANEPKLCEISAFAGCVPDAVQKLFTRFGKWSAKLDLKKVLLKPSPQLEFVFADGDG